VEQGRLLRVVVVAEQVKTVEEICAEYGGGDFRWTARTEDRDRLWAARHDAAYAAKALRPGCRVWPTDVCVPISRLTECIVETRDDLDASGLTAPIVGHVGDGNFHIAFVVDPDDASEIAEAKRLNDRLIKRALAMDGTCTGEHGIGLGKLDHLEAEHGPAVDVMRSIKRALDPADIMNPGKTVRV
jgi:D-lactate dehydrogenase (cytochrome)